MQCSLLAGWVLMVRIQIACVDALMQISITDLGTTLLANISFALLALFPVHQECPRVSAIRSVFASHIWIPKASRHFGAYRSGET